MSIECGEDPHCQVMIAFDSELEKGSQVIKGKCAQSGITHVLNDL